MYADKKLGQHFLRDTKTLVAIARAIKAKKGECVIEIGAGHGELTEHLLKEGLKVVSIEKDRRLIDGLMQKFEREIQEGTFRLVNEDVRDFFRKEENIPSKSYSIVGNIPYYITGLLLRMVSELPQKPKKVIFLIQKEVAQRACAKEGDFNMLAASIIWWADAYIEKMVPRGAFVPPPKVDSAVLVCEVKKKIDEEKTVAYYEFIKKVFKQPRKTLYNNLVAGGYDAKKVQDVLQKIGIDQKIRPQNLSYEILIKIFTLMQ